MTHHSRNEPVVIKSKMRCDYVAHPSGPQERASEHGATADTAVLSSTADTSDTLHAPRWLWPLHASGISPPPATGSTQAAHPHAEPRHHTPRSSQLAGLPRAGSRARTAGHAYRAAHLCQCPHTAHVAACTRAIIKPYCVLCTSVFHFHVHACTHKRAVITITATAQPPCHLLRRTERHTTCTSARGADLGADKRNRPTHTHTHTAQLILATSLSRSSSNVCCAFVK